MKLSYPSYVHYTYIFHDNWFPHDDAPIRIEWDFLCIKYALRHIERYEHPYLEELR